MDNAANTQSESALGTQPYAPKYIGLAHRLLRDIAAKGLKPGDRLGTETELVGRHRLSRATVRQALSVLERDGYISRHRARGTFVGRAVNATEPRLARGTVLIVCSNEQTSQLHEDIAFASVLRLTERALARQGFAVQMLSVGENNDEDQAHLRRLVHHNHINGICTIGNCFERYRGLVPGVPIISSCTFTPLSPPWVGQDIKAVSHDSVEFLLKRGHRRIAMVCTAGIDQNAFALFAAGYRQALAAADVPMDRQILYHAYAGEPLTQLMTDVLSAPQRPTAIFAENWRVCRAALAVASQLGLRIPDDFSLVGYGQNAHQLVAPISITSYVPDAETIGQTIGSLLTRIIDGEPINPAPQFVPGRLVEGDSVRSL